MATTTTKEKAENLIDNLFAKIPSDLLGKNYCHLKKEKPEKHFPTTAWDFSIGSKFLLKDVSPLQKAADFLSGKNLNIELTHGESVNSLKISVNNAGSVIYSLHDYEKAFEIIDAIIATMIF